MATTGADKARARELLDQGASLYEEGNLHDALECWNDVLLLDPGNPIAEEYLRFVRESFQIDIDAFLAHQDTPPSPDQLMPPPGAVPVEAQNGPVTVEQMDWGQLLTEGPELLDDVPPVPDDLAESVDFFVELQPGGLSSAPGEGAAAWGHGDTPSGTGGSVDMSLDASLVTLEDQDPMTLPTAVFAEGVADPRLSKAADSVEILPELRDPPGDSTEAEFSHLVPREVDVVEAVGDGAGIPRSLISAPNPATSMDALMAEARRRQQLGDFSGSLELVEQVLARDAEHGEARAFFAENRTRLFAMYRSRLGNLGHTPRVRLRQQEIVWQSLDHREGFILSQIDGRTSFDDVIEISGMDELEATRILARLVEHDVIG